MNAAPFRIIHDDLGSVRWTFSVEIPETSAYFVGHFPGRPILPAVAQIDLIGRLLRRFAAPRATITRIEALRLMEPIRPGSSLTVVVDVGETGEPAGFRIQREGRLVTRGSLCWQDRS